jgi:hypothetical protein
LKTLTQIGRYSALAACIAFLFLAPTSIFSQKDDLKKANELYNEQRYQEALIYLNRVEKVEQSGPLLFKRALINYHTNILQQAERDFTQAVQLGYKNDEIDYYLAEINHQKGRFSQAAEFYKLYLKNIKGQTARQEEVYHKISQCGHALRISYQPTLAVIDRLPGPINSIYDDFSWLPSPNDSSTYYFTTNRPNTVINLAAGHYEIYSIKDNNAVWSKPKRMSYPINSRDEEIMIGFNDYTDGIYLLRQEDDGSSKLLMHRRGDTKGKQREINVDAKFSVDNAGVFFYNDNLILFAADMPDGYGGYDLYFSVKEGNEWSQPENMGPSVNSSYDELEPKLTNNGEILYFSSDRPQSIGGFDIFRCNYLYESEAWSEPYNLGIPINSPGNDQGLQLSADGLMAHFNSDRKTSYGGFDIYTARFKERQPGQEYYAGYVPFTDYEPADQLTEEQRESLLASTPDFQTETNEETSIAEAQEYSVDPIYHVVEEYMDDGSNQIQINRVRQILEDNEDILLELISSGNDDEIIEYSLFASMKRAEAVKKKIVDGTKIDPERINVTGIGRNYPMVKQRSIEADKYNTRVDLRFSNVPEHVNIDTDLELDVPNSHMDYRYEIYRTVVDAEVSYRIEIATVSQMYRGMALSLFNDTAIEKDNATGLYSYTIGLYDNYAEAILTERSLEREGVVDAKVVPYINGRRISEDQLIDYVNEYSALRDYMNYNPANGTN